VGWAAPIGAPSLGLGLQDLSPAHHIGSSLFGPPFSNLFRFTGTEVTLTDPSAPTRDPFVLLVLLLRLKLSKNRDPPALDSHFCHCRFKDTPHQPSMHGQGGVFKISINIFPLWTSRLCPISPPSIQIVHPLPPPIWPTFSWMYDP